MSGKLIVIEGLDGSGKATQSALLRVSLEARGFKVRALDFPRYDSDSSALVRMYLRGDFGSDPDAVNSYAAAAFYAVDRAASYLDDWRKDYEAGAVLVADRYTTSNAVYQTAKLPVAERSAFLEWLFDFEYNKLALPAPDAVIYLDMDIGVSERLLAKRYGGDESKKDIHEKSGEFQRRCRSAALACADKRGWHIISCDESGEPRSESDIAADVMRAVELAL